MALFVLVKRKGSKKFLGLIPTKTRNKKLLSSKLLNKLKKGFSFKIVSGEQAKRFIVKMRPKQKQKVKREYSARKKRVRSIKSRGK